MRIRRHAFGDICRRDSWLTRDEIFLRLPRQLYYYYFVRPRVYCTRFRHSPFPSRARSRKREMKARFVLGPLCASPRLFHVYNTSLHDLCFDIIVRRYVRTRFIVYFHLYTLMHKFHAH